MNIFLHGVTGYSFSYLQLILIAIITSHISIACTTIYLHRCLAHNTVKLHPAIAHFCRFWMWMTTTTIAKEWVAVHRKHHVKCETVEDPHSPKFFGIKKLLFKGYSLYRQEANKAETIERYGNGLPNDWIERHIYSKHKNLGLISEFIILSVLFGLPGLLITLVPMFSIGFLALGVVNGIGHYIGYRNFNTPDNSRNFFTIGIILCGEELHNNHHGSPTSPFFSVKWFEVDLGGIYLKIFAWLGLAKLSFPPAASKKRFLKSNI